MTPHDESDDGRTNSPAGGVEEPQAGIDPHIQRVRSLRDVESEHVQYALRVSNGNKMRAAQALGISRDTLYRKIAAYGLTSSPDSDRVKHPQRRPR